jgi:hypothetical protein
VFRKQAQMITGIIASFKDKNGTLDFNNEELKSYFDDISAILKKSNKYLKQCGLTQKPPLWKYNPEDPTTHASSVAFKYKHKMSRFQIKMYGKDFMSEPVPEDKKEA